MQFNKWAEKATKKLKWYDIKLAQIAAMFVTLTLIVLCPGLISAVYKLEWYWYLIAAAIVGFPVAKKVFFT